MRQRAARDGLPLWITVCVAGCGGGSFGPSPSPTGPSDASTQPVPVYVPPPGPEAGVRDTGSDGASAQDAPSDLDAASVTEAGDEPSSGLESDSGEGGATCESTGGMICAGACVDAGDPMHCGSCGNACPGPPTGHGQPACAMGIATPGDGGDAAPGDAGSSCGLTCATGYHACAGDCTPNSEPSAAADPCVISEALGVFASPSGSDGNPGTRSAPVATLGHAMDLAKAAGKRVYACGGTYAEQLVVDASRDGVNLYGGLDCKTWAYDATQVAVVAPPSAGYALQLTALALGVTFEDAEFDARPAPVATPRGSPGASSIAVFASGSTGVVLRRCKATAGLAAFGTAGVAPMPFSGPAPSGSTGVIALGGAATANPMCPTSVGGAGAPPAPNGSDGSDGAPLINGANINHGVTGPDCTSGTGGAGAAGADEVAGVGASNWGTLSASGWTPSSGQPGHAGDVGQGGGGGASLDVRAGAGGGGAGGCGGPGGGGGSGGGSSIAVLAFHSSVDLDSCTLVASDAGNGGRGVAGLSGQAGGGPGKPPDADACPGGSGGAGGAGGPGGAGAGGLSAGIAWSGVPPTLDGGTVMSQTTLAGITLGRAGQAGGLGGTVGAAEAVIALP